jgi:LDH2 family malate/lactate/ureidoglycolate dehydrogenase
MDPSARPEVLLESPCSVTVDACGGMGAPTSVTTMRMVLEKATTTGIALGVVRNSNHFGIAGYYAMMALEHDMVGIAMTNTAALGVPTFGREPLFGTNPIAFAAPANEERAFVLDMATTVVTRGKVEVYDRQGKSLPVGWAVDEHGASGTNSTHILDNLTYQRGGGILPLGGLGELLGGHKGYGLSVLVDVLCGLLSASAFGPQISDAPGSSARVSHFFGAFRIDLFRDPAEFRCDMDRMLSTLRESPPAAGHRRVYYAGLKEFEHTEACAAAGVPLPAKVYSQLVSTGDSCGVEAPLPLPITEP